MRDNESSAARAAGQLSSRPLGGGVAVLPLTGGRPAEGSTRSVAVMPGPGVPNLNGRTELRGRTCGGSLRFRRP